MKKGNGFDIAERGAVGAFDMWDKHTGTPTDSMDRTYTNLSPTDFSALIKEFGPDKVASYIKTMELRRMKVR